MSNQQLIPLSDAVIVRQENIATIVKAGPESYRINRGICERGLKKGQALLDEITAGGMTDELDMRIAGYLSSARKSVTDMNERRSSVTKLFDMVRSEFTLLENTIDPTKKDTIPYQLSQYRNAYAAKKREEQERLRQEQLAAQELAKAKETYRVAVEEDYRRSFSNLVSSSINDLTQMNSCVTLDNYTAVFDTVTGYQSALPADWCPPSTVRQPYNLSPDEAKTIRDKVFQKLLPQFREQFIIDVDEYRCEILDKLPSKKIELERMAEADAAEAARLKADIARREAEEAARKEQERQKAEAEAARKAELDKANAEMAGLFSMAKAAQVYTPKTKVSKKIKVHNPAAYLAIISLWWQHEGCKLSVDELAKIFKKQLTFCEKLATKEEILVENTGLEYYDDVKAQ